MTRTPRIRLLVFTPTLQCGGSENFVSMLCNNIDIERFDVTLVILNNAAPFYTIRKEVKIIDLGLRRVLFSLPRIKAMVKETKPDIIFTTANHLNLYFAIFRDSFPKKIKLLARESSIVSINSRHARFPRLYDQLCKRYLKRFDLLVCQSDYMRQDLIDNHNVPLNKTVLVSNATAAIDNIVEKPAAGDPAKFISIGRLSTEKGIERLVHAVGLLSTDFRFHIIGDGDQKDKLQTLVKELHLQDQVVFEGQRSSPFSGMEDADLLLMGSYYEGSPNALLEAGVHGIPVIAFNSPGGIAEIIRDQENGLLVEDNDIIGFARAIKTALSLRFDRHRIAGTTLERYSIQQMIGKMESIFTSLKKG